MRSESDCIMPWAHSYSLRGVLDVCDRSKTLVAREVAPSRLGYAFWHYHQYQSTAQRTVSLSSDYGEYAGKNALSYSLHNASQWHQPNQVLPLNLGSVIGITGQMDYVGTIVRVLEVEFQTWREVPRLELKVLVDAGDDGLVLLSAPVPSLQAQALVPRVRAALAIASKCMM